MRVHEGTTFLYLFETKSWKWKVETRWICPYKQHEVIWVSGFVAPFIFHLGTRYSWMVSFKLRSLFSRRKMNSTHLREAGLTPVLVLTLMRRKIPLTLPGNEAHFLVGPSVPLPLILCCVVCWILCTMRILWFIQKSLSVSRDIRSYVATLVGLHNNIT